jgi:hypothetical protein
MLEASPIFRGSKSSSSESGTKDNLALVGELDSSLEISMQLPGFDEC